MFCFISRMKDKKDGKTRTSHINQCRRHHHETPLTSLTMDKTNSTHRLFHSQDYYSSSSNVMPYVNYTSTSLNNNFLLPQNAHDIPTKTAQYSHQSPFDTSTYYINDYDSVPSITSSYENYYFNSENSPIIHQPMQSDPVVSPFML
jgi:hypothetical protein